MIKGPIVLLFWFIFFVAGISGWMFNLWKLILIGVNNEPFDSMCVVRTIGIFVPPIGAVLGYF